LRKLLGVQQGLARQVVVRLPQVAQRALLVARRRALVLVLRLRLVQRLVLWLRR